MNIKNCMAFSTEGLKRAPFLFKTRFFPPPPLPTSPPNTVENLKKLQVVVLSTLHGGGGEAVFVSGVCLNPPNTIVAKPVTSERKTAGLSRHSKDGRLKNKTSGAS